MRIHVIWWSILLSVTAIILVAMWASYKPYDMNVPLETNTHFEELVQERYPNAQFIRSEKGLGFDAFSSIGEGLKATMLSLTENSILFVAAVDEWRVRFERE